MITFYDSRDRLFVHIIMDFNQTTMPVRPPKPNTNAVFTAQEDDLEITSFSITLDFNYIIEFGSSRTPIGRIRKCLVARLSDSE